MKSMRIEQLQGRELMAANVLGGVLEFGAVAGITANDEIALKTGDASKSIVPSGGFMANLLSRAARTETVDKDESITMLLCSMPDVCMTPPLYQQDALKVVDAAFTNLDW